MMPTTNPRSFLFHYNQNVPIVTICWVTFFALCFLVFLVLSLCSESHCACCYRNHSVVNRMPGIVATASRTSRRNSTLHHSLMQSTSLTNPSGVPGGGGGGGGVGNNGGLLPNTLGGSTGKLASMAGSNQAEYFC